MSFFKNRMYVHIAFSKFYDIFILFYDLCFSKIRIKKNFNEKQKLVSRGNKTSCKIKGLVRLKYYKHKTVPNKLKYLKFSKLLKTCIIQTLNTIYKLKKNATSILSITVKKSKATWTITNNEVGFNNFKKN